MVSEPLIMSTSSSTLSSSSSSTPHDLFPNPYLPNIIQVHHFLSLKLTPTNFLFWKTQFLPLLQSFDLLGLINGTNIYPSSTLSSPNGLPTPNPAHVSWTCHDQLLLSWIIASLLEEVLPQVVGLSSLLTVWTALHQAFGASSHTRILQLTLQLQSMKMGDLSISAYLRQAKYLADELAAADQPLSLAKFNAIIFNNFELDFSEMIATLSVRAEPISFHELQSLLVSHEIRVAHQQSTILPTANLATTNSATTLSTRPFTSSTRGCGYGCARSSFSTDRLDPCPV